MAPEGFAEKELGKAFKYTVKDPDLAVFLNFVYNNDINIDLFKASMRKQEATLNQRLVSAQDTLQTIREKGMDMYKVISHKKKKTLYFVKL